jgi:L-ascorbate metabolism protein UlaG (beta-lactamase superfamily)
MRVRWHGHACFEIAGKVKVVTDPHDGESIGLAPPKVSPDVATVSHEHYDHNAVGALGGKPEILRGPGRRAARGIEFVGVETCHDEAGGQKRGKNVAFAFSIGGVRFAHLGDLGHVPTDAQVNELGAVDVLFVPVGGVYTVDAAGAVEVIEKIGPRVAVPMHYRVGGLKLAIAPLSEFSKKLAKGEKPREVGTSIEFEAEDLPEKREYWVFSL